MNRRKAVALVLNGSGLAVVGIIATPALIQMLAPVLSEDSGPDWRALGPLETFPLGEVQTITVANRGLFVWRRTADDVIVYSRACTDLGCPLTWDRGSTWYFCPCHGGIFDADGIPRAGPPKRPLWRYATRKRDGFLEIDLKSVPPMA